MDPRFRGDDEIYERGADHIFPSDQDDYRLESHAGRGFPAGALRQKRDLSGACRIGQSAPKIISSIEGFAGRSIPAAPALPASSRLLACHDAAPPRSPGGIEGDAPLAETFACRVQFFFQRNSIESFAINPVHLRRTVRPRSSAATIFRRSSID